MEVDPYVINMKRTRTAKRKDLCALELPHWLINHNKKAAMVQIIFEARITLRPHGRRFFNQLFSSHTYTSIREVDHLFESAPRELADEPDNTLRENEEDRFMNVFEDAGEGNRIRAFAIIRIRRIESPSKGPKPTEDGNGSDSSLVNEFKNLSHADKKEALKKVSGAN